MKNKNERPRTARTVLALNVARLRLRKGLSQERLAELAGFHRTYVSQLERGLSNVTLDNLEALAAELGVLPHSLLRPQRETDAGGEEA